MPAHVVPRAEQRRELGTDAYHRGVVYETIWPAVTAAMPPPSSCARARTRSYGKNHCLTTAQGRLQARDVVIATNGYTGALLRRDLVRLFPELATVRVSHSWMGLVAYTFDTLAHIGCRDGIHYAMGYCGSGVSMAGYLCIRIGQ